MDLRLLILLQLGSEMGGDCCWHGQTKVLVEVTLTVHGFVGVSVDVAGLLDFYKWLALGSTYTIWDLC